MYVICSMFHDYFANNLRSKHGWGTKKDCQASYPQWTPSLKYVLVT